MHRHNIAEIVSLGIIPDLALRFMLPLLPDPVAVGAESAPSEMPYVVERLTEAEKPVLCPAVPCLWRVSGGRWEPAGDAHYLLSS